MSSHNGLIMDFQDFLNKMYIQDHNGDNVNVTIQPWMIEARKHDNVLANVARRVGTTSYIMFSALYDILFTNIDNVVVVTCNGGYRKRHFIDELIKLYSLIANDIGLDNKVSASNHGVYISGKGCIEIYGLHECANKFRGKSKPTNKLYGDVYVNEYVDDVLTLMVHAIDKCVLFFQGIPHNSGIKQIFDKNAALSDEEKVIKTLKEEFYWHSMTIMFENKRHTYYPDMFIKKENLIIEVKGRYWYDGNGREKHKNRLLKNLEKKNSVLNAGYNYELWLFENKNNFEVIRYNTGE